MNQVQSAGVCERIRRKIYLLVSLVCILGLLLAGESWRQEMRQSSLEQQIHMHHMASVHDLIRMQKELQDYRIRMLSSGNADQSRLTEINTDTAYNLRQLLDAVSTRQQSNKDKAFNVTFEKMDLQTHEFMKELAKGPAAGAYDAKQILERIQPLLFSLEQLQKLHMISHSKLLKKYDGEKINNLRFIILLCVALMLTVLTFACYVQGDLKKCTNISHAP